MDGNQALQTDDLSIAAQHLRAGNLAEAETVYRQVLKDDPEHSEALRLLGLLANQTGHADQAINLIKRAAKLQPGNIHAHFNLGTIFLDQGFADKAVDAFEAALQCDPTNFACMVNLGNALVDAGEYTAAMDQSQNALEIDPNCVEALCNLGQALAKSGQLTGAMAILRRAILLRPSDGRLLNNLGVIEQAIGLIDQADETFKQALKVDPECHLAERNISINTLNLPDLSTSDIFAIQRKYGQKYDRFKNLETAFSARDKKINRKLRVGYLSSDFHAHPVGFNTLPLINHHDRQTTEIFIYSENEIEDDITNQFKSKADHWHITKDQTDAQLAYKIRQDEIDILVCLAGRFNLNRPTVAAYRAAPIQVSYHDCATSGLVEMDYWLTDNSLHPSNSVEKFSEELFHIPIFYQYSPPLDFPEVSALPYEQNGFLTFGSFNKLEKINHNVVETWSGILKAVPRSKLFLKHRDYFCDPKLVARWQELFSKHGIAEERLILTGSIDERAKHLSLYDHVDIALDPFPFNGATTTFEALAMGVPVITLTGRHFVDRVGGSLVQAVGMDHLVADTTQHYIEIASKFSENLASLADLRQNLRQRVINSTLCDGRSYALSIEAAYREMWRRWCEK